MSAPEIVVLNRHRRRSVATAALARFTARAVNACRRLRGSDAFADIPEVTIVLMSDASIARLHRRFMKIDGPTDVITFQHGEICISLDTAARNARAHSGTLQSEVRLYVVHGLLHLLGYDDKDAGGAREMAERQVRICAEIAEEGRRARRPVR